VHDDEDSVNAIPTSESISPSQARPTVHAFSSKRDSPDLHGRGYVHRDIKPSNIFRNTDGSFVIGDFGSVVRTQDTGCANALTKHSIIYMLPEDFYESNRYYRQGDVYQIGICLFQVLGGCFPYGLSEFLSEKKKNIFDSLEGWDASIFGDRAIEKRIRKGRDLGSQHPAALRATKVKTHYQESDTCRKGAEISDDS